jgi:tetratricopeptide (TPR) repeat protein
LYRHSLIGIGLALLLLVGFSTTGRAEENTEVAADDLKYSRDFYSKVHFVAIANLDFGAAGTAQFKYDRYPNGGPERIQTGDGEFARKDGKTWLKSNDWGETGKPVDAQTAKRLNNWIGLIDARLNGEPASKDPSEGATEMKFIGKEDQGEREEFVFEESKEKPKAKSYPHIRFGRFKNAQDQQVLLSEFSGAMRLGGRDATVKISFSHLIAVNIQDVTEKSPSPASSPSGEDSDENLVNRGIEKAKNGDLDGAIVDFDRAAKADPQNDAPYYNRAQAKWLKKDTSGAIADYTRAIELGSTNPAAYNNRGNARAENNDQDGAIADYTRAIELKPNYARACYNRAMAKEAKGDKAGAAADFKRAKELDPELASEESAADSNNESDVDLVERGIEKGQQGDLDGALADLNRAIELDPKNSAAYYNRAATKLLKKDTAGAIADYTHVIELDPKNVNAYNNRGILKARNNDPDGAIADYNHAIELDPKEAKAYNNRGNVKKAKGDLDGAIADFTSAIGLDSNLAIAYKNRGEARQAKGDAIGAEADLKNAEKIDLVNRGIEKAKKGDLDGALAEFNRAIKLSPNNAVAYYNRAHAKRLKKDAAGALADCTRAIELDPKFGEAYFERGTLKGRSKDVDGAIADFTRAIELKPDHAYAYYNRGIARKAKGDKAGADADFKNAAAANRVSLLDGKLKIDISPDFSREPDDPAHPKTIAKFSGPADGVWGEVLRGTHGLTPDKLEGYLKMRVAEYSKGFKWLPKDSRLQWLKKEIVTIDGRKWADWRYIPVLKGKKDYSHNPVYTRFLTTSYKGQLLEITFTSNLNTNPELKEEINHIMDSVHLEE